MHFMQGWYSASGSVIRMTVPRRNRLHGWRSTISIANISLNFTVKDSLSPMLGLNCNSEPDIEYFIDLAFK